MQQANSRSVLNPKQHYLTLTFDRQNHRNSARPWTETLRRANDTKVLMNRDPFSPLGSAGSRVKRSTVVFQRALTRYAGNRPPRGSPAPPPTPPPPPPGGGAKKSMVIGLRPRLSWPKRMDSGPCKLQAHSITTCRRQALANLMLGYRSILPWFNSKKYRAANVKLKVTFGGSTKLGGSTDGGNACGEIRCRESRTPITTSEAYRTDTTASARQTDLSKPIPTTDKPL